MEEGQGLDTAKWEKLKSGTGWISLDYVKKSKNFSTLTVAVRVVFILRVQLQMQKNKGGLQ
ncbi:MAG: hypothetical protein IJW94_05120 [Oscillospiraceae bacterium]|nr:hypothetical protein [Oscillospiraceae bacterium]